LISAGRSIENFGALLVRQQQFAVEDIFAKDDAIVADIHARPQ